MLNLLNRNTRQTEMTVHMKCTDCLKYILFTLGHHRIKMFVTLEDGSYLQSVRRRCDREQDERNKRTK